LHRSIMDQARQRRSRAELRGVTIDGAISGIVFVIKIGLRWRDRCDASEGPSSCASLSKRPVHRRIGCMKDGLKDLPGSDARDAWRAALKQRYRFVAALYCQSG
jgi:hypothetical protein